MAEIAKNTVTGGAAPSPARVPHPRGLRTLFFTEMWERFSYYGMRALLVLFMVDAIEKGGMGLTDKMANAIYGLYTAMVYMAALAGGWIADRLLGAQRAVWYGGIVIAVGHFTLAIPRVETFFLGLLLVIMGSGLLKPNISAIVGQLYPEGGARRDAGFTIFYMGINLGAAIGPIVCGYLGEEINWHYGFGAAGIGMLLGLLQFRLTSKFLGDAGRNPHPRAGMIAGKMDGGWWVVLGGVSIIMLIVSLAFTGVIRLDPVPLAQYTAYFIISVGVIYFIGIFLFGKLDSGEKRRIFALIVLLLAAAMFWSGFEQAGSSLNLFAKRSTDRTFSFFGVSKEIPASWFQFLNPAFILIFAPVFASLWVGLTRRLMNPSTPAKFALGLILLSCGFLVLVAGVTRLHATGQSVLPTWLILTYLLHTWGELCLSPVGLSAVTKLAPARFVGQMMGLWFLAASLGNLVAGLLAGELAESEQAMSAILTKFIAVTFGSGLLLLLFVKPIKRLMGEVKT
jgi:POT family proton-dependent oligopeptide transporter